MIINNDRDSIHVSAIEDEGYAESSYAVYNVSTTDCIESTPILVGSLDTNGETDFEMPDGIYNIKIISPNGNLPPLRQDFLVIYNFLPTLISYIEDALCRGEGSSCIDCSGEELARLYDNYYKTTIYLFCIGALPYFKNLRGKVCMDFNILSQEEDNLKYFGSSNYNTNRKIKEFFAYLYAELYYMHNNSLREGEPSNSLTPIYKFSKIEKCFYRQGLDYKTILCELDNLNCNCDE